MFFKQFLKRSDREPAKVVKAAVAFADPSAHRSEAALSERRMFARALPVAEVLEQDWATWVDVTDHKTSDK
jgi:hypothetical protein